MKVLLIDMGAEVCFIRNTVGVGDINLALGKPATESSTYTYSIPRCNSSSNSSANMISADCDEGGYRQKFRL
jgi:hypothetical protein